MSSEPLRGGELRSSDSRSFRPALANLPLIDDLQQGALLQLFQIDLFPFTTLSLEDALRQLRFALPLAPGSPSLRPRRWLLVGRGVPR